MTPAPRYLTATEAVALLRLGSRSALYRLIREHRLPHLRRGARYLFDPHDLDHWMRTSGLAAAPARTPRRFRLA